MTRRTVRGAGAAGMALAGLLAGCGSGGGAGGGAAPEAGLPRVGDVAIAAESGGDVVVEVLLVDGASRDVAVTLQYRADGRDDWANATLAAPGRRYATSPEGVRHRIDWNSLADLGPRADLAVELRAFALLEDAVPDPIAAATANTALRNLEAASDRVGAWMFHFGPLDAAVVAIAETHDLVVLDPNAAGVTRALVADIQDGVDPADPTDDVIVLGRVDVGEDPRTVGWTDPQLALDPRFVGDGKGPRVDPRGRGAAGAPLTGLDALGEPSDVLGMASYYLDDVSRENLGVGDGIPDRNPRSGACFVNMGDPAWFAVLDAMRLDGLDGVAGIAEILTETTGRSFGFDGLYLDNVDTAAPNWWTWAGSPVQTEFEWTAAGFRALLQRIEAAYPDALLMQNRGLFFYNPAQAHYAVNPRSQVDFVLFASYRLDASPWQAFDPYFFADNKHNFMPRLQAEANRADGFQVLSLGFAEGPGISPATLVGGSGDGMAELFADIFEAQEVAGFRHYLVDGARSLPNAFVRTHADVTDLVPPRWSSTFNDNHREWPTPPRAPTPRVGLQRAVGGIESVTVSFDVALDENPVRYVLYVAESQFDFRAVDPFAAATRFVLDPEPGVGYADGVGADRFPYQATVQGLAADREYWLCLRAVDALGNQDDNTVVQRVRTSRERRQIVIDGDFEDWRRIPVGIRDGRNSAVTTGPDWKEISLARDDQFLYVRIGSFVAFDPVAVGAAGFEIRFDADNDPFTGWRDGNLGSDLAVRGDQLVRQTRTAPDALPLGRLTMLPAGATEEIEFAIPLERLDEAAGGTANLMRVAFLNAAAGERLPRTGFIAIWLGR